MTRQSDCPAPRPQQVFWEDGRLWQLLKSLAAISVGLYCASVVALTLPIPTADSSPTAGQTLIGLIIIGGIAGAIAFGFLHVLEWVYRGFFPVPVSRIAEQNAEKTQPDPRHPSEPDQPFALPNPAALKPMQEEIQQRGPTE